jgi:hypothetical protein
MILYQIFLGIILLAGCSTTTLRPPTPVGTHTPGPTLTAPIPSITPGPVSTFTPPPATSTVEPSATWTTVPDDILIHGSDAFVQQTRQALDLLRVKAPDAYSIVTTYVSIIEEGEHSGMWANEEQPRYEVNDKTAFYSLTWYASTIAHDATHSELYHKYLDSHPGQGVPDDIWIGVGPEKFCIAFQLDVLKRIGGPSSEVDYLATQTGTHCDLDGDGDCDYADYLLRDW